MKSLAAAVAPSLNDERLTMNDELKRRFPFIPHSAFRVHRFLIFLFLLVCAASMTSAQEKTSEKEPALAVSVNTGTITGRVTGDDGRPLPDAVVYFYRSYARVLGPPLMATTDAEGRFQATNLAPGLYTVWEQFRTADDQVVTADFVVRVE